MKKTETHQFQAETQKLLNIIIHSIYTNKEVFLRELISNASDALDKIRFEQNKGTEITDPDLPLEINITLNKDQKALTITDTGIGMDKEEVVANLGTIAKSGTEEFLRQVAKEQNKADNIIGQFGVGFYSVFMVADRVKITSRSFRPQAKPVCWESDGSNQYQVYELEEDLPRGTKIEVKLKDDCVEFTEPERIKAIIKKHSNFISFPILVDKEKVNTTPALWKEPKFKIKKEDYAEFYKFLTYDSEPPLETIHIAVDAPVQFNSLLFIPKHSRAIFENQLQDYGLDLYVHRVLIQKKNQDLVPQFLGFIQGMVDTEDLPLNLAREAIQESPLIRKIRAIISKQILKSLTEMASQRPEDYQQFWKAHNKIFKLGYTEYEHQETFAQLLRFNSSTLKADKLCSLDDYLNRLQPEQKEIYYISGTTREQIQANPHLEIFTSKGIEVLFLLEPIDEFILQAIGKYKDYPFKAVEHADPDQLSKIKGQEPETEDALKEEEIGPLLKKMRQILQDRVTEVRVSKRLKNSPACVLNPDQGISSQMQKILQVINKDSTIPKQIFEINPGHDLTKNLLQVYKKNPEDALLTTFVEQLFDTALLQAGYLNDPQTLAKRSFKLLEKSASWYSPEN